MLETYLSNKDIPCDERLIFAVDYPDIAQAKLMVKKLGDSVQFYKIGLELFLTGYYYEFVKFLKDEGKKVFADLKLFDIPETVARSVEVLSEKNVDFLTVHGNDTILAEANKRKKNLKILGVTALTSLDNTDLRDLGFQCNVENLVISRAKKCLKLGCDGIVSSGLEVPKIRKDLGSSLLVICPGIRPVANIDDHKRAVSVEQAFLNGADYVVVGRPIKFAKNPQKEAELIQEKIEDIFS